MEGIAATRFAGAARELNCNPCRTSSKHRAQGRKVCHAGDGPRKPLPAATIGQSGVLAPPVRGAGLKMSASPLFRKAIRLSSKPSGLLWASQRGEGKNARSSPPHCSSDGDVVPYDYSAARNGLLIDSEPHLHRDHGSMPRPWGWWFLLGLGSWFLFN